MKTDRLAPRASWGKVTKCGCLHLTPGRALHRQRAEMVRVDSRLPPLKAQSTLQCLQAPRVTNHEIESTFLERDPLGQHCECGSFEAGPSTCITHEQVSTLLPPKRLPV